MKIKTFFISSLMAFITLIMPFSHADTNEETKNYAVLLASARHVSGVIKMFELMHTKKDRIKFKKARIVIYGDAIHTMKKNSELARTVKKLKKINVTIAVCAQALKRLSVPHSEMLSDVEIVENAYYEILRLKTLGYITLDL